MVVNYGEHHKTVLAATQAGNARERKTGPDDLTSKIVGDFGKWQAMISILMSLLKLPTAWYQLNIVFLAPPQDFWCEKPQAFSKYTDDEWRAICSPKVEEHPCSIYDPDVLVSLPYLDKEFMPLIACTKFVYDKSVFNRTICSEWDLVCSRHWYIHAAQFVMMWGILLGGIIFGILADKYGRKNPLLISIIIQAAAGFASAFVPWFWVFMVNRFILALASGGIAIVSFVICMETVGGKWRTTIPVLYHIPFGLGNAIMAGLAYWLRDWRKLEFALASLSSLFIFYYFLIPESPRWLLATGQNDKALEVLKDAARMNKRDFNLAQTKLLMPKHKAQRQHGPKFMAYMKSRNMRLKTILLSINWFCTGLAFYTFAQYLGNIGDDIFLTVAVSGIISTPGALICVYVVTKVGRKKAVGGFQLATAFCFLSILLIPDNTTDWPRIIVAGIGLAGMAGSVPALYLYTGELYPTLGRNVGVGGVTTFARIGSMIAPALVDLDNIVSGLPLILLALMSFGQLFLMVPLPETKDLPLPDTFDEAEKFTRISLGWYLSAWLPFWVGGDGEPSNIDGDEDRITVPKEFSQTSKAAAKKIIGVK